MLPLNEVKNQDMAKIMRYATDYYLPHGGRRYGNEAGDIKRAEPSRPPPHRAPLPGPPGRQRQKEWRRLAPILQGMRVLTEADYMALANLCQTYSTLVKAQEKLNEVGILYKTPGGYVMQSPLLSVVNNCVDTVTKLSREFGLTSAARSRSGGIGRSGRSWNGF